MARTQTKTTPAKEAEGKAKAAVSSDAEGTSTAAKEQRNKATDTAAKPAPSKATEDAPEATASSNAGEVVSGTIEQRPDDSEPGTPEPNNGLVTASVRTVPGLERFRRAGFGFGPQAREIRVTLDQLAALNAEPKLLVTLLVEDV